MIFDNSKLAIIFVVLFLIIVSAAFLILRTRVSNQNQVGQSEVVTVATPTATETPMVVSPQVVNPNAPTPTTAPVAYVTPIPQAPQGTSLPRTAYPIVLAGVISLIIAGVGFKLRKFPQ